MTRRYTDISRPRPAWTFGDRVMIGVAALLPAALFLLAFLDLALRPVHARDMGQWEASNPQISAWYRGLMQPDNPQISCCGEADAYWADTVKSRNGKLVAVITDDRPDAPLGRHHVPVGTEIPVPTHKIKWDRGNPTGHIIIFLSINNDVYCYVQSGGV